MKTLYLDTFAGISGNMLLGALLDAGVPFAWLQQKLAGLNLGDYELVCKKVTKCGLAATYFNVLLPEEHACAGEHGEAAAAGTMVTAAATGMAQVAGRQDAAKHEDEAHHHHRHHEDEQDGIVIGLGSEEDEQAEDTAAGGGHHHHHHHHEHRNYADILDILAKAELPEGVRTRAQELFLLLAKAEGKVHGKPYQEIHFHEVGAIDTIIDIVGCLLALDYLQIDKIYFSRVTTGTGFVRCAHGLMPVPAPATAALLAGLPQQSGNIGKELTTPTGAVLLRGLAEVVADVPADFVGTGIGYGAGSWDLPIPNVVRAYVGSCNQGGVTEAALPVEALEVLECNLDDSTPEVLAYVLERLLAAGALDAWLTPIVMKKGRCAQLLSVLTGPKLKQSLEQLLFAETSTLGIRSYAVKRTALPRKHLRVQTGWGEVGVKCAYFQGSLVNVAPEFEDCKKLAQQERLPLKQVMDAARLAAQAAAAKLV